MFRDVLDKSYFISRPFNNKNLTTKDLVRHKLYPRHKIKVGNREIYLSDKFKIANN